MEQPSRLAARTIAAHRKPPTVFRKPPAADRWHLLNIPFSRGNPCAVS